MILACEASVALDKADEVVEESAEFLLPSLVLAAVQTLVAQVMEHGVGCFRLLSDGMHDGFLGGFFLAVDDVVPEIASGCESVLKETVEDIVAELHQIGAVVCFAVLKSVEGVEQDTAAKTDLHVCKRFAIVAAQAMTRIEFQREAVHIRLGEVVAHSLLHLFCGVERLQRLRIETVEAVRHEVAVCRLLLFLHSPDDGLALSGVEFGEGEDGRSECQLADIAFRGLYVGIAEGEECCLSLSVEAGVAHGGAAGEYHFALGVW